MDDGLELLLWTFVLAAVAAMGWTYGLWVARKLGQAPANVRRLWDGFRQP